MTDFNKLNDLIRKLTNIRGTSGREENVASSISIMLSEYMTNYIDRLGNVIGTNGNNSGIHILLDAHTDQIGMSVAGIDDDGFVMVNKCGGIDPRILTGAQVTLHGRTDIKGFVCSVPPHLRKDKEDEVPSLDELRIDIGYKQKEACEVLAPGDRITLDGYLMTMLNNRVCSPSLDDRAGVAVIFRVLEIIKNENIGCRLSVLFSSMEETGGSGATVGAFAVKPDEAIVIDVSFAKQPDVRDDTYAQLGKGPMIGFSPVLNHDMSKKLRKIARENSISFQNEVMGSRTGTNADEIQTVDKGVKTSVISIPLRYMHTGAECCSLEDIESTAQLIAKYIIERGKEQC